MSSRPSLIAIAAVALLIAAPPASVQAQIIEFDPPTEIVVDESRVTVTFIDAVDAEEAEHIVASAGGTALESKFPPVDVWGLLMSHPSPEQILALRSEPAVLRLEMLPPAAASGIWVETADGRRVSAGFGAHGLHVTFAPDLPDADAASIVHAHFPELPTRVDRQPNEVIVSLGDDGEAVVARLESDPRVLHVTYFSISESEEP